MPRIDAVLADGIGDRFLFRNISHPMRITVEPPPVADVTL